MKVHAEGGIVHKSNISLNRPSLSRFAMSAIRQLLRGAPNWLRV
jgi:hypothetical protein